MTDRDLLPRRGQAGRRPDYMIKTMPEPRRGSQLGQSRRQQNVRRRRTSSARTASSEPVFIPLKSSALNHVLILLFKSPLGMVNALVVDITDDGVLVTDAA